MSMPPASRIAFVRVTVCAGAMLLSLSTGAAAATAATHFSAPKTAPPTVVKPGDPGSSQYQEDVPSAFGSVPATKVSPRPTGPSLPDAVASQLRNAGAAGRAAAAVAVAGTPRRLAPGTPRSRRASHAPAGTAGGSSGGPGSSAAAAVAQAGSGRGIVGALVHALVGADTGVGALLPVLLVASVLLAAVIAMRRRRRSG